MPYCDRRLVPHLSIVLSGAHTPQRLVPSLSHRVIKILDHICTTFNMSRLRGGCTATVRRLCAATLPVCAEAVLATVDVRNVVVACQWSCLLPTYTEL